jgi:hypothetical protein
MCAAIESNKMNNRLAGRTAREPQPKDKYGKEK